MDSDYGAFFMVFAEYFSASRLDLVNEDIDIKLYRERIACLLYHYGMMKFINNIESDDEELVVEKKKNTGKRSKRMSKMQKTIDT